MTSPLILKPGALTLDDLRAIWQSACPVALDPASAEAIAASGRVVDAIVAKGDPAYGINTGFGRLAKSRIANDELELLQRNLILSHSVGTGDPLSDAVTRLVMVTKVTSLARGYSGVRPVVIDTLVALLNAGIVPLIPAQGSVGASGDLAPLAHMTLALLGEGDVTVQGRVIPAAQALADAGIAPVTLAAKEGLALINGTQVSTALALHGLFMAERLMHAGVVVGALSVDAARGSVSPFDARIHAVRGQPGQIATAAVYRELLANSPILASHQGEHCDRVQDPYSLRCQPQVMGACLDHLRFAAGVFLREANAVSDNPLVFDNGDVLSGGNFHAEPVAMAADVLALVISEIGALSERRIAQLVDPALSGLPAFLVTESGLNSGFMIAQVSAAALASENKTLAHPASVDSLPTSANQEDHVSMATFAARRLADMAFNSSAVVAIELLAAAQGVEFHRPMTSSVALEEALATIRRDVARYERDRYFAPDLVAAQRFVSDAVFETLLPRSRLYAEG